MQRFNPQGFNSPNQMSGYCSPRHGPPRNQFPFTPPSYNQGYERQHWRPQSNSAPRNQTHYNYSPSPYKKNKQRNNDPPIEAYFKPSMLENPWKKLEESLIPTQTQTEESKK